MVVFLCYTQRMRGNNEYGFLTREILPSPERPVLGLPTRIIHGVRNAVFSLPILDTLRGVANTVI